MFINVLDIVVWLCFQIFKDFRGFKIYIIMVIYGGNEIYELYGKYLMGRVCVQYNFVLDVCLWFY